MNVIVLPRAANGEVAPLDPVAWVVAGLRWVGEPATSQEIVEALRGAPMTGALLNTTVVDALLAAHARPEDAAALFQPVCLRGRRAWGFTPALRTALRDAGFGTPLRLVP